MWLTRLSIQRPVFIIMLIGAFLVLGLRARSGMRAELNPSIEIPYVTITAVYPGAGPEEIETLVAKPLEDAVGSVNNIKNVTSTSQEGVCNIVLEFYVGTELDAALSDVRQKVDAARGELPRDIDPPVIQKLDINATPVVLIGMSGNRPSKELRYLADEIVKYRLSQVPGVGSVAVTGGDVREVQVSVDRERLRAYGLSIDDVISALTQQNLNLPSGRVTEQDRDYSVRLLGEFTSLDEIKGLRLPIPESGPRPRLALRVVDVATVSDTVAERDETTRVDRNDSVGLVVIKLADANTVEVVEGAKRELVSLRTMLPADVRFTIAQDESIPVRDALEDVNVSLILGAFLAVLVVFLFLHNLRGTFIVALAIPTSIIATFLPMYAFGFTLNQMTMLALSLVVGILVDDSIVVIENIYRHLARGERPREAALNGRSEIGLAAVTITLVDVVVFVPIAFMGGVVGQFFRQFGLTVAFATLFSLFVSFTLTPMLASRLYRAGEELEAQRGLFARLAALYRNLDHSYRRLLGWALRHRLLVVMGGVGTLVLVLGLGAPALGFEFLPAMDQGIVGITAELPVQASLAATDRATRQIEDIVQRIAEVDHVFTTVGSVSGGFAATPTTGRNYASLTVNLKPKVSAGETINPFASKAGRRRRSDQEIAADLRQRLADLPGVKIIVSTVRGFAGLQAPIQLELTGDNLDQLTRVGEDIRQRIATVPGVRDTDISVRVGKPEVQVRLDRLRAADLGLGVATVATALRNSIEGNTDSKYREAGTQYDIRVQFRKQDRNDVNEIGDAPVGVTGGHAVVARDIAHITLGAGPTKIDRKNRLREVVVTGNLAQGFFLGNVEQEMRQAISEMPMGGIRLNYGGESEVGAESMGYLMSALVLSIILVYMLMASLFNSVLHPLTIMLSLPMALVGAVIALVLTGKALSIVAMIGLIMLVGLVTKNAILLVDYTNTLRARGLDRDEALQEAGPTRLRPILMTTFAMVFGMLPTALQLGRASQLRAPLAIAVIGGLILSTLLTLVMIPVIYTYFDSAGRWLATRLRLRRQEAR